MTTGSLRIPYQSENFPSGNIPNRFSDLVVTWDDILWAAVTVGRPNRSYVFRHGMASNYEALFRWSLVRMAIEQRGFGSYRLRRTDAAKTLDPTEKGAVNYFLGMTFCKLFAAKLLNTPWLLHLDVFRPQLDPILIGRSRPDLVGKVENQDKWHAFECKGRISPLGADVKTKAKSQAQRLVSVNGIPCSLHVGGITYFQYEALSFYWCDPEPNTGKKIEVPFSKEAWENYYSPVVQLIPERTRLTLLETGEPFVQPIDGLDLKVSIHPVVAKALFFNDWNLANKKAEEASKELLENGYHPDGIAVHAGPSWHKPFEEMNQELI